jgi:hypothetical protein
MIDDNLNNDNFKDLNDNTLRKKKRQKIQHYSINLDTITKKIENDAENKVKELFITQSNSSNIGTQLCNIMQAGSNEFKEKTGRNMTYLEMRQMFG